MNLIYLKNIKARLQELKKAALTPDEFIELAADGLKFVEYIEPSLTELFDVTSFSKQEDIARATETLSIGYKI